MTSARLLTPAVLLALAAGCASAPPAPAAPATAQATPERAPQTLPETPVAFAGNASVADAELRRAIADDIADLSLPARRRPAADDAAWLLEQRYAALGFPFARVTVRDAADPGGLVEFVIEEGPRTVIDAIHLRGNERFGDDELRELFHGPTTGAFGTGPMGWVQSDLAAGVAAVGAVYWGAGYLQAQVDPPESVFSADRTHAEVTVRIREGRAYRLARAAVRGAPPEAEAGLREELAGYLDQPYFPQVAWAARARLLEFWGARGCPDAAVTFEEQRDDATGEVSLLFTVEPGPVVTVGAVRLHGIARTREEFVLSRLFLRPGETWSEPAQRQSAADLQRSGLFDDVAITLEPGPGAERAVDVALVERASREAYLEPGFGSYEGARLTLGYRDRNVAGGGRIVHAEGSVSGKARRALVGLTDPWFLDGAVVADVSVFANHREEPSFDRDDLGASASFLRRHSARWQSQWAYTFKRSEIAHADLVDPIAQAVLADVDISSISFAPAYESRDDLFAPTRGSSMRGSLEWGDRALGSELDFLRARFGQSWFRPVALGGAPGVLALSLRTGAIVPTRGGDVIPLQERFFNGGENTVRSFREDELGPKDSDGNPLGGEAFTVVSVELRRELAGRLDGALFLDAGNVVEQYEDYFRFPGFASAIGAGLRYRLPIGPIRLDVGANPSPHEGEDHWVAHLSVGMPF